MGNHLLGNGRQRREKVNPTLSRKINILRCRFFYSIWREFELRSGASNQRGRKKAPSRVRWIVSVFLMTVLISALFSYVSSALMHDAEMFAAFIILFVIIFIGILFDMIGVAVASADERPFHSMAARKVPEAVDALRLVKNADRVSSICNDVIGDICGVVSGSASALIAAEIVMNFSASASDFITLAMSALVAGLTVGGKACGKGFAMRRCTLIIQSTAKVLCFFRTLPRTLRRLLRRKEQKGSKH